MEIPGIETVLAKLGLSAHESTVYLDLLQNGPATIGALARRTGLYRPTLYKLIPELIEKGLVTRAHTKGKQQHYRAEPPERLEALFETAKRQLDEALPELASIYTHQQTRPIVRFLEGKVGIRAVFADILTTLKRSDIFYRYSSIKELPSRSYLPPHYEEIRDKKQLERLVITNAPMAQAKPPRLERETKVVPSEYDLFDDNVTHLIYGDKVAVIDYNTETVIIIESKVIAEFQRKLFLLLYRKL
ncbi:MAG: helix-turn-helix domain-containing protein [bacterium]|nr:helix-turn-helix domain-containing protein [bacterium]